MPEKGKIHSRERAKQLRDFSGLRFGNITPTDLDGMIEYHDRAYVYIETKYHDADMETGQTLAFQRQCDDAENAGKHAIFMLTRHEIDNPEDDIPVAETIVERVRFRRKWIDRGDRQETARELIGRFFAWVDAEPR